MLEIGNIGRIVALAADEPASESEYQAGRIRFPGRFGRIAVQVEAVRSLDGIEPGRLVDSGLSGLSHQNGRYHRRNQCQGADHPSVFLASIHLPYSFVFPVVCFSVSTLGFSVFRPSDMKLPSAEGIWNKGLTRCVSCDCRPRSADMKNSGCEHVWDIEIYNSFMVAEPPFGTTACRPKTMPAFGMLSDFSVFAPLACR